MDRKKTILIAVIINAGLLAVLFITAICSQDEIVSSELTQTSVKPLFSEELEPALQQRNQIARAPSLVQLPPVEPQFVEIAHELQVPAFHQLPPAAPEQTVAPVKAPSSLLEVVVKKGDNLDKIAKAHHTSVDVLMQFNQLTSHFLKLGQVLKIPDSKAVVSAPKTKPVLEHPVAEKLIASGPEYYTVKVGDNPWTIAMKHHMKVDELLKLNQLNEEKARKLRAGDRLRIR